MTPTDPTATPAPVPTAVAQPGLQKLQYVLGLLDGISTIAAMYPGATAPAGFAHMLLQVAIKTNAAHMALFGQPLDMAKLKDFTPVE